MAWKQVCLYAMAVLLTLQQSNLAKYFLEFIQCCPGDRYAIKPWFTNPYNSPDLIYWMICPTHQIWPFILLSIEWCIFTAENIQSVINVSSKSGGTKLFTHRKDQCNFGRDTFIHMYQREFAREKQQQTRLVPGLKLYNSYFPSKIRCWVNYIGISTKNHHLQMLKPQRRCLSTWKLVIISLNVSF